MAMSCFFREISAPKPRDRNKTVRARQHLLLRIGVYVRALMFVCERLVEDLVRQNATAVLEFRV